ncbi:aldolase [Cohnella faecalis]|uniref:aldolase n=1 Tax=Cohnella faecalis TaxID=2315694 RepID=UPI0011C212E3|nr:aldolase [Cohnella faecalis]
MSNRYIGFGLQIWSELTLPELVKIRQGEEPDVRIEIGDLKRKWEECGSPMTYFAVKDGEVFFNIPNAALFRIDNGNRITVSPEAGADEAFIRLYLLGLCMSALLLQRGVLPLHGSAVVVDGLAFAFLGNSGSGKSTLAAAFTRCGFRLLSDDVIAISASCENNERSTPVAIPSFPYQKLWNASLEPLGLSGSALSPIYGETTKYAVPASNVYSAAAVPLSGLFELLPSEDAQKVDIAPVSRLERFPLLGHHTFRNFLVPLLDLGDWHFRVSASIAAKTDIYRLRRPTNRFALNEMVDRIVETARVFNAGGMGRSE